MNRCNLSCSFCSPATRPACTMSPAVFEILARAVAPHCRYIYLHVKGEPLLHPQLGEILDIAAVHGLMVNITTNALLLPQQSQLLLHSPAVRQVNISLHGYTAATHGELRPWMDALCDYANRAAANGKFTVFRFWTLGAGRQPDATDLALLAVLEQKFGADELAQQADSHSVTLQDKIFISFDEQFDWPSLAGKDYGERGTCYGSRTMLAILADGTVVPCCLDSEGACPLGNALQTPFEDILTSDRLVRMSHGFMNRRVTESLCRRCGYRLRFGGNTLPNSRTKKRFIKKENSYEQP